MAPLTDDVQCDVTTGRVTLAVAGGARVDAGVGGSTHRVDGQTSLVVHRLLVAVLQHLITL